MCLPQEGRNILDTLGLYNLQDNGYNDCESTLMIGHRYDERKYDVAISSDFGCYMEHPSNEDKALNVGEQDVERWSSSKEMARRV